MRALGLVGSIAANRRGSVPRPSYCTYLVSFRCNARCGMCDSWRMKPGREMTAAEVATVFEKIGQLDIVRITGGEPFLREDLLAVAEAVAAASRPLVLHITTNGSFPERVRDLVSRFSARRRLEVMVSLDGMPAEHDRNRGPAVTFALAMQTVRELISARVPVSVNHTIISPQSLDDHRQLVAELARLDVDVTTVIAYAESSMYGIKLRGKKAEHMIVPRGYPVHPDLAGADITGFVKEELARVPALRSRARRVGKRYYLRGLLARLAEDARPHPHPSCVALRSHLRLLPDGRVPVCQFNTEVTGDLLTQSFDDVWHGDATRAARAWVDACPGCWAECEVIPSAIYTGDIVRGIR